MIKYVKTCTTALAALLLCSTAFAADKPNILIIWGDDIGQFNISAYNLGMMGYKTPNIDRIAKEGALFTDWYGQQSCTAGRAAFITGQSPMRTGLTKVGLPGSPEGMKVEDPTIKKTVCCGALNIRIEKCTGLSSLVDEESTAMLAARDPRSPEMLAGEGYKRQRSDADSEDGDEIRRPKELRGH